MYIVHVRATCIKWTDRYMHWCSSGSLVPRPPPRFYLAAVEKKSPQLRDKIWAEAWEQGYSSGTYPSCRLSRFILIMFCELQLLV